MKTKSPLQIVSLSVLSFAATAIVSELPAQGTQTRRPATAADTGFVEGKVRNLATGVHLANAYVALEGGGIGAITQPDGSFSLALPPGSHVLVATYAGLDVARQTVIVTRGQSVSADGLQVRAMANYRSRVFAGTNVFDFDRDERLIYDLKVQYSINERYNVYLDVANLTNEETRADVANPGMYWIKLNPGAVYSAGVNVKF